MPLAKKKCINDGKIFTPTRKTAKFCSPACRSAYARTDTETGEILPNPAADRQLETEAATDRARRLAGFEKVGLDRVTWLSTGIPELDTFQQIPRGRITQIQGPFSVGKTTLALNMIGGLADKQVLYIDSEASLNPDLLVDLGLDPVNFHLYNKSAYIEDIYDEIVKAAKAGIYDMIIFDSLASCTTRTEEANDAAARNIGGKALMVNKLMRIVPMELKNSDTALVIINQEREMIGTYVPTKYTPGGMGPLYAASLILGLKTIPSWRFPKDAKNGAYKGHEIEVTILKSKVSRPHRKSKIKLYYQESFDQLDGADRGNAGDDSSGDKF